MEDYTLFFPVTELVFQPYAPTIKFYISLHTIYKY
nr:MAG TPA: hypothetical protein [Caudoviricetes sp.]